MIYIEESASKTYSFLAAVMGKKSMEKNRRICPKLREE
jgi:hypothetical protein